MAANKLMLAAVCAFAIAAGTAAQEGNCEYKLLATNKTGTMKKEINQMAAEGFHFAGVMGGETAFGGNETVVIMERCAGNDDRNRFQYELLATNKTGTMQKEIQASGNEGYEYKGQTVFQTSFGGQEVVIILERDKNVKEVPRYTYKLLATKKTGTMQKELSEVAADGFKFVGITVAETAFGGKEVVVITRKVEK